MLISLLGIIGGVVALALVFWWMREGAADRSDESTLLTDEEGGVKDQRRHADVLNRLSNEIPANLSDKLELNKFLDWFVGLLMQFPGVDCACIYLIRESDGAYEMVAHRGVSDSLAIACRTVGPGTYRAKIAASGCMLVREFKDIMDGSDNADLIMEGIRSSAMAPVLSETRVIATLNVGSHRDSALPPGTVAALEAAARQVAGPLARLRGAAYLQSNVSPVHSTT